MISTKLTKLVLSLTVSGLLIAAPIIVHATSKDNDEKPGCDDTPAQRLKDIKSHKEKENNIDDHCQKVVKTSTPIIVRVPRETPPPLPVPPGCFRQVSCPLCMPGRPCPEILCAIKIVCPTPMPTNPPVSTPTPTPTAIPTSPEPTIIVVQVSPTPIIVTNTGNGNGNSGNGNGNGNSNGTDNGNNNGTNNGNSNGNNNGNITFNPTITNNNTNDNTSNGGSATVNETQTATPGVVLAAATGPTVAPSVTMKQLPGTGVPTEAWEFLTALVPAGIFLRKKSLRNNA